MSDGIDETRVAILREPEADALRRQLARGPVVVVSGTPAVAADLARRADHAWGLVPPDAGRMVHRLASSEDKRLIEYEGLYHEILNEPEQDKVMAAQEAAAEKARDYWRSIAGESDVDVAKEVVRLCELPNNFRYVYESEQTLWDKMKTIATQIYGALDIVADSKIRGQIKSLQEAGYGHYPVCVAKTQSSFTTDPNVRGAPSGHMVNVREVRLAAGAEFIVMICGDIMTMPGLPKVPAANSIDVDENGKIVGLF